MHKDRTLLIFLHGSAGSGIEIKQFLSILPLSSTDPSQTFVNVCQKCQIDLVTPTAAERAYTPMFGQKMNVWYDRAADFTERGVDEDAAAEDIEGIDKSLDRLVQLLQNLVTDPTFSHVFIGGFSMGGGISLQVYSRISQFQKACNGKLRGLFSMGSFHPNSSRLLRVVAELRRRHEAEGNKGVPKDWVPVLMLHGDNDDFILPAWGKTTATNLLLAGIDVRFHTYADLGHEYDERMLKAILDFMQDTELHFETDSALTMEENKELVDEAAKLGKFPDGGVPPTPASDPGYAKLIAQQDRKDAASAAASAAKESTPQKPYTLEQSSTNSQRWCIHFEAPAHAVPMLVSRPILACGGMFDVCEDRGYSINNTSDVQGNNSLKGVYILADTTEPEHFAYEIGRRLAVRIDSKGESVNACPMA